MKLLEIWLTGETESSGHKTESNKFQSWTLQEALSYRQDTRLGILRLESQK